MIAWHERVITNRQEFISEVVNRHPELDASAAAFDTETNGLHLKRCRPFVFQFGWVNSSKTNGYAFAIDLTATPQDVWQWMIEQWYAIARTIPVYLGHNVKFDLHMMRNLGCPYEHFENINDTQIFIRMAHDNIPIRHGGVSLKLKEYAAKYITADAKDHDRLIQQDRTAIAKMYNMQLKQALGWTISKVDAFFEDSCNTPEDLPNMELYLAYWHWHEDLPPDLRINVRGKVQSEQVPYTMVNRKLLLDYAMKDIVYTLETWLLCAPVVIARGNEEGVRREQEVIEALFGMEELGFDLDTSYVQICYERMRNYIKEQRAKLIKLAGENITCNQNARIMQLLQEQGVNVDSTGIASLNDVKVLYKDTTIEEFINTILELRTLEKWMSTYLMRFLGQEKLYTQLNQVGAASGRLSSDFQQFPKGGLKKQDGTELFNPRRAIKVPGGIYNQIVYLDYSQIELRVQALYTILLNGPDLNLCRAYMPYKCVDAHGNAFDPHNKDHIARWQEEWFLEESPEVHWTPLDVHGATTKAAFSIDETHPDFSKLRGLGKRVNFAKNYGAQERKIHEMFPEYPPETIKAIDQGYYKAFPGIKIYQEFCYDLARCQPYATNLYGVRYWNVSGHKLINMMIQGSSAYLLKEKIVQTHRFLKDNNCKSKLHMSIHDENSLIIADGEDWIVAPIKAIMEDCEDWPIPIVADTERTYTYWSVKEVYDAA